MPSVFPDAFGGIKTSYRLFMTLCVSVKEDQLKRLPAYKEEFLASVAKVSVRLSISNTKRLDGEKKLGKYCI